MSAPHTVIVEPPVAYPVLTLDGRPLDLQSQEEATFYTEAQGRYTSDNVFTIASDLRSIDRLVFYETLVLRWSTQLASGKNYQNDFLSPAEEEQLRKNLRETTPLISSLQSDLGLTKAARDKDAMESVSSYITKLKAAAKEHGVKREKELGVALELVHELFSLTDTYRRSSEAERRKLDMEDPETILDWISEVMKPRFDQVDAYFRQNSQRFWLRQI